MSKNYLTIISDKSFKRDILFSWELINLAAKPGCSVNHIRIEDCKSGDIFSEANSSSHTILYAVNNPDVKLSELTDGFSRSGNPQYNLVFDCWQETGLSLNDKAEKITFVELAKKLAADNSIRENCSIVLINPCGWQKESTNLGIAMLAGALKMAGFKVHIFDLNSRPYDNGDLINKIKQINPFVIGYSAKTATAKETVRVCDFLKPHFPDAKMVIGGPHATLFGAALLESAPNFDLAVGGEAESAFVNLCLHLYSKISPESLKNTVFRSGKQIIENEFSPPADINFPFWPNFDCIDGFSRQDFCYPLVTSRGCPYDCIYCCVNKLTGGKKWRARTAEHVLAELEYAKQKYKIDKFEILDDNFTLNLIRAKRICELLIKRRLKLSWWCHNGIRADCIDKELAGLMKKSGCTSVAFGVESGTDKVFNSINKGETLKDIGRGVKTVRKAGIKAVGYFLIGLPGDNLESFVETVRFQRSLKLDHYTYGVLIPYPKTKLWDIVQNQGRMLKDVTETQHFAADVVPVSFELPSFPAQDVERAFYITRYFELYDFLNNQSRVRLIIDIGEDERKYIEGLLMAVPNKAQITVECLNTEGAIKFNYPFLAMKCNKFNIIFSNSNVPRAESGEKIIYLKSFSKPKPPLCTVFTVCYNFMPSDPIKPLTKKSFLIRIKNVLKFVLIKLHIKISSLRLYLKAPSLRLHLKIPSLRIGNKLQILKPREINVKIGAIITALCFSRLKRTLKKNTRLKHLTERPDTGRIAMIIDRMASNK